MEEKLYFKPADYGKGTKKKVKPIKNDKKGHRVLKLVFIIVFVVLIVLVILWLLRGKTTTTGRYPENVKSESLECASNQIVYSKADKMDSENKELKITMIFYGENELSSGNLKYTLHLDSHLQAAQAESLLHSQFAKNLSASGHKFEEFDNKFTVMDGDLVITLHLSDGKINEQSKDYFLIEQTTAGALPKTLSEYRKNYENQGFSCKSSLDK